MSVLPDRNIWIRSRVPQQLQCSECGRTSKFVGLHVNDLYEYSCSSCGITKLLTLPQINAIEANRFHRVVTPVTPINARKWEQLVKG